MRGREEWKKGRKKEVREGKMEGTWERNERGSEGKRLREERREGRGEERE